MNYVGIDPGKDGGIVLLKEDGSLEVNKIPQVGTETDIQGIYKILKKYSELDNVVFGLEDVKAFPGIAAVAMSKLMELKGIKQGILVALEVSYVLVAPKTWQKIAWDGVPNIKKGNMKNDTKAMSLIAAKRLFPKESFLGSERSRVPHDGIVDAALICTYLKSKF